jgi:myo-inositol-1(or 4)-monophosphatase
MDSMPGVVRTLDAELAAAHAAVDDAVEVMREARAGHASLSRIRKAEKDFLTEVDLASEAALKAVLTTSTPHIGFFGEEGGGDALDRGRVWVADPLDGTVNFATGSPLCGVMLALMEDGAPVLGVIDLPFLGVRVDACIGTGARTGGDQARVSDVPSLREAIVAMGDAFHRGGPRHDAFLELTTAVHRNALRLRCIGSSAVLWSWLAAGQIQGMVLAHNNPYDVAAGHIIADEAGALVSDYAGKPLNLRSTGAMACVPGPRAELLALGADLARAATSP